MYFLLIIRITCFTFLLTLCSVPSPVKNAVLAQWKDVESGSLEFTHMRCTSENLVN